MGNKVTDWHVEQVKTKEYKKTHGTIEKFCNHYGFSSRALRSAVKGDYKDEKHPNVVYMVVFGNHVKIGRTTNFIRRLKTLKVSNPFPLRCYRAYIDLDCTLEKELHEKFSAARVRGEWFELNLEIAQYIRDNKGVTGE